MTELQKLPHIKTIEGLTLHASGEIAAAIAMLLIAGDLVTLRGEVGAGKTSFAQKLIYALAPDAGDVTSPTFNLMQSYDVTLASGQGDILWHLDLYRLEEASEAAALGLDELEAHIMLIEWPEIIEKQLPGARLDIYFTFGDDAEKRTLLLHGNEGWRKRLGALRAA